MDDFAYTDLEALAELNDLRGEALDLYDYSLAENNPLYIVSFIERQVAHVPPRLDLLLGIANDLQQRLLSLRESHFDVREKIVDTFKSRYHLDITPLIPPDQLHSYHNIDAEMVFAYARQQGVQINEDERPVLIDMICSSRKLASQLQGDIDLTTDVHKMIVEWTHALSTRPQRQNAFLIWNEWNDELEPYSTEDLIH